MSIQRVNFESLSNGGDNPSDAFRKLDANDADLQDQIDVLNNGNGFDGNVNIDNGSLTVGKLDSSAGYVHVYNKDSGVQSFVASAADAKSDDGSSNRGGLFVSDTPNRSGKGGYFAAQFFLEEIVGRYTQACVALRDKDWLNWNFRSDGNIYTPGGTVSTSDRRIKSNFEKLEDALDKVSKLTGYNCDKQGIPVSTLIAQDVQAVLPRATPVFGDMTLKDGTVVKDVLGLDNSSVVALLVNAVNELSAKVDAQAKQIDTLLAAQHQSN